MFVFILLLLFQASAFGYRDFPAQPNYRLYHKQDELLRVVKEVVARHPDFMKIEEIEKSVEGYSVTLPVVTVEPGGFTEDHSNKIRLLMSFGEHGREIISPEFGLELIKCLESEADIKRCIPDTMQYEDIWRILNRTFFKIIPVENPKGRASVESGNLCERKNGRGVDINRNWDIDYGKREKYYDPEEEYEGESAFSEPETAILRDISTELQPHVWVGVHSGTCAVFMPYDHVQAMPKGKSAEAQLKLSTILRDDILRKECKVGSGGGTVGYVAHGTGTDYMHSVLHVPLAFTWEIYGDDSAPRNQCYRTFNPTSKVGFHETLSMWTAASFRFFQLLPDHPDTPDFDADANHNKPTAGQGSTSGDASNAADTHQVVTSEEDGMRRAPQKLKPQAVTSVEDASSSAPSSLFLGFALLTVAVAVSLYAIKKTKNSRRTMKTTVL